MKAVLDTNVVVSGLLTPGGNCGQIVDMAIEGSFELFVDGRILSEYEEVLQRPELKLPAADTEELLRFIRSVAVQVVPAPLVRKLPDLSDISFLEVAACADAVLITGNKRHFPSRACHGVTVLSPKELLEWLASEGRGQR